MPGASSQPRPVATTQARPAGLVVTAVQVPVSREAKIWSSWPFACSPAETGFSP